MKMNTKLKNKALLLGLLIASTGHAGPGDENTPEPEESRLSRSAPSSPERSALSAHNGQQGQPVEDGEAPLKLSTLGALRAQVEEAPSSPIGSTVPASGRTASVAATNLTARTMYTVGSAVTAETASMLVGQNVSLQQRLAAAEDELNKNKARLKKLQEQTKRQQTVLVSTAATLVDENPGKQIEGLASLVRKFGHKFNDDELRKNVDTLRVNAGKYVREKENLATLLEKERKKTAAYAELTQQLAAAVLQLTRDPSQPAQTDDFKPAGSIDNLRVMIDILNLLVSQKEQELEAMVSVKLDKMLLSKEEGQQLSARASAAQLRGFFISPAEGQPSEFDRVLGNCQNALQKVLANNGMFGSTARVDGLRALTAELNALIHVGKLVLGADPALRFAEEHDPSNSDADRGSILEKVHSERAAMAARLAATASEEPEEEDDGEDK